jgi:hypothetical protein
MRTIINKIVDSIIESGCYQLMKLLTLYKLRDNLEIVMSFNNKNKIHYKIDRNVINYEIKQILKKLEIKCEE